MDIVVRSVAAAAGSGREGGSKLRWLLQADFLTSPWHPRTTPGRCFEPELATSREMPSSRRPSLPHPQISRQADWHPTPLHAEP